MLKGFAVATAVFVLGSSYASAQAPRDRFEGPRPAPFSREDAGAFLDARIAALHSGLRLTTEQEGMWPAFEQAYRDVAKLGQEQVTGAPSAADDPIAGMQRRADALTKEGAALKSLADAAAPLWQSFDEGQKRRFAVLARPFRLRFGFIGRGDDRFGPPGRDGDRFGPGRRGFGPGGFGPGGFGPGGFGPGGFGPGGPRFGAEESQGQALEPWQKKLIVKKAFVLREGRTGNVPFDFP